MAVRLMVGFGNPGERYARTRHNAGVWFVEKIAAHYQVSLSSRPKFKGIYGNFLHEETRIHLLVPETFMNHSGQSVRAVADFYQITPEDILIAHDELDLPTGDIRLKYGGGHGGHNGLKDIMRHLSTANFYRLRIGIAHPGVRDKVTDYVLSAPSREEQHQIEAAIDKALPVITTYVLEGKIEKAMQVLHT